MIEIDWDLWELAINETLLSELRIQGDQSSDLRHCILHIPGRPMVVIGNCFQLDGCEPVLSRDQSPLRRYLDLDHKAMVVHHNENQLFQCQSGDELLLHVPVNTCKVHP